MEVNFWLVSLPAIVALSAKSGIYAYARLSRTHNFHTRLYLLTLFAFSLQNVAEIAHFHTFINAGRIPNFEVDAFYAATIMALAFLFHLTLTLVFDPRRGGTRLAAYAVYLYALALEALLLFTPWLIEGYTPIGKHSVTRIPGVLYGAFELYAAGICFAVVGILIRGIRLKDSAPKQRRAKIVLAAIIPLIIVAITVIVSLHAGLRIFNAAVIMPMALTFFLAITAYATHQHRLFEIGFFIPWSKVRKRKTAFYTRVRATVAEIADLGSVNEAVNRLSQALNCSVVLVNGPQPILALTADAPRIADFPATELRAIEQIVVANEIVDAQPRRHALMKQHGVAAIVPFYPHSRTVASWMLLGDSFSDNVYTPLDFKVVEELFERMGELFLDKLLLLRSQLHEAREELQTLQFRLDMTEKKLGELHQENVSLRHSRFRPVKHTDTAPSARPSGAESEDAKTLDDHVSEYESRIIEETLKQCGGNKSQAARMLGLRPNTLHYKIERYGLAEKKSRN